MKEYDFPIGWELVRDVVHGFQPNSELRQILLSEADFTDDEISRFVQALHGSAQNSVDAFLEEQEDFLKIGIATMSMVLIRRENTGVLYREWDPLTNWLRNLILQMRGTTFEGFSSNAISFVTFNYDRSLEYVLCETLANTFSKTEDESGKIISQIPIIHLHGRLGFLPWQNFEGRPYDTIINRHALDMCIKDVKVVHRNTEINADAFKQAKALLAAAERIYFLGVGFSNQNLMRLGIMELEDNKAQATGVGLIQREWGILQAQFGAKLRVHQGSNSINLFRTCAVWD
jgi:hypothetical protein